MPPHERDALPLNDWLDAQPHSIHELLARAHRLAQINQSLTEWSTDPWVSQVRVANVRDRTVVLFSASAACLVPLRFRTAELLSWLNRRFRLDVDRLELRVKP